jgi:hypothetical protein
MEEPFLTSTDGTSTSTFATSMFVDHWTHEANEGRFEVHILGFHLAGIPTYILPGELAISHALWGDLPRPLYPDALRRTGPPSGWDGRTESLTTPTIGQSRPTRLAAQGDWRRLPFRVLTLAWPIEASGRSTRSEWSNGRTSPVSTGDSQASVRQRQT